MGCNGCGSRTADGLPAGCNNNGWCGTSGCGDKLDAYDWLQNVYFQDDIVRYPFIQVKFKGTRKEFFRNPQSLDLETGDPVVVEAAGGAGWDIGVVCLKGPLVPMQMRKQGIHEDHGDVRNVLRRPSEQDLQRYEEGKNLEFPHMIRTRDIARDLGLVMKVSDVEYQGDRTKATFFYTADGRVDFRELIRSMAREFRIKIEMRQIGLRQEAGRLGGIGSCGRELCCSTWLTEFNSVPTTAARYQNLFLNPLKLSGQCGRLKCCLNYELDTYIEALNDFPDEKTTIKTEKGLARCEKLDILKKVMWFKYDDITIAGRAFPLEVEQVRTIIEANKSGTLVSSLEEYRADEEVEDELGYVDTVGEERLDRFDPQKRKRSRGKKKPSGNRGPEQPSARTQNEGQRPQQGERPPQQQGNRPQQGDRNRPQGDRPQQGDRLPRQRDNAPNPEQRRDNNPNPNRQNRPQQGRRDEEGERRGPQQQQPDAGTSGETPQNREGGQQQNRQRRQEQRPRRQPNEGGGQEPRPQRPDNRPPREPRPQNATPQGQNPEGSNPNPQQGEGGQGQRPKRNNRRRRPRGNGGEERPSEQ